jgi:hypothetical protein
MKIQLRKLERVNIKTKQLTTKSQLIRTVVK